MNLQTVQAKSAIIYNTKTRIQAAVTSEELPNNKIPLNLSPDKTKYVYLNNSGQTIQTYPYIFGKTLLHDNNILPLSGSVDTMLNAVDKGTLESVDEIERDPQTTRPLEGIISQYSVNMLGSCSSTPRTSSLYSITSPGTAFEMAEVYAMSLSREVNFDQWSTNATISKMIDVLNQYPDKTTAPLDPSTNLITASNLFRGRGHDELLGPYISQCLICDFNYGNLRVEQKYIVETPARLPGAGFAAKNIEEYRKIATGRTLSGAAVLEQARHINNPMVLGSIVHNDPLYQFYYNAALVCLTYGGFTLEHEFLGTDSKTSGWTMGGSPDILANLAFVSKGALLVAWENKWGQTRIRPEACANLVRLANNSSLRESIPGLSDLYNNINLTSDVGNNILNEVRSQTSDNNALLLLQYPEGSPTHPSFPAGHAVVAGACVTVLKCFIKTHNGTTPILWSNPQKVVTNPDGTTSLDTYTGDSLTLVGELNKIASNVALGRDWAGVHYRADGDLGINLGEQYAIDYMINVCQSYSENLSYSLQKYDGTFITISADGVAVVESN